MAEIRLLPDPVPVRVRGVDVRLFDPRIDAEPAGWDALRRRAGLRANWAWPVLRAGVRCGHEPVLVAVLSTADAAPVGVLAASVVPLRRRADRPCPAEGWPRLGYLHVQAPQSSALPGWWLAPSTVDDRAQLIRAFRRAARRRLGPGIAGVLWRQLGDDDLGWLPHVRYRRDTEPLAVLDAPASVDAWLAGLGRGRRHDLRRITRGLARDADLTVRTGPVGDVVAPAELAHLARLNFDKHTGGGAGRHSGPRSPLWQEAVAGRPDVLVVAYRDGAGRLLAAGTVLDHETWPLWLSWGAVPHDQGGRRHLYFDMFRRLVERSVDRRAAGVVLGKGMAALKADLGARLIPQHAALTWC